MGAQIYLNSICSMVRRTSVHSRRSTTIIRRPATCSTPAQWGHRNETTIAGIALLRGFLERTEMVIEEDVSSPPSTFPLDGAIQTLPAETPPRNALHHGGCE
jgi:hypothetical protein